jgi:hypothetical protein
MSKLKKVSNPVSWRRNSLSNMRLVDEISCAIVKPSQNKGVIVFANPDFQLNDSRMLAGADSQSLRNAPGSPIRKFRT